MKNISIKNTTYIPEKNELIFECSSKDIPFRFWNSLNTTGYQIRNNEIIWSGNIQFINNNVLTNNNKKRKITNETDVCHGKLININNHWNSDDKLEVYWCID